jgi:hypothetical protein
LKTANVYIDGFNLYHGALSMRPACKWLDLWALGEHLVPKDAQLQRVRFFTARVDGRGIDPSQPQRQDAYWRALRSRAGLITIHKGNFKTRPKTLPLETPPRRGSRFVRVLVTEEKGSDVNLATHPLLDAAADDAQIAIVVSDDFDLKTPLAAARAQLGRTVGVVSPRQRKWLSSAVPAHFYRPLKEEWLVASQFPEKLVVDGQNVTRPAGWA